MSKKMDTFGYVTYYGWMLDMYKAGEITLPDLMVLAFIWGFRKENEQRSFHGSLEYMEGWLPTSKSSVQRALAHLVELGILTKEKQGETVPPVYGIANELVDKYARGKSNYSHGNHSEANKNDDYSHGDHSTMVMVTTNYSHGDYQYTNKANNTSNIGSISSKKDSASPVSSLPTYSTSPANLVPSLPTESEDFVEESKPLRLTRGKVISKAKKIFKEAGLSTQYGMRKDAFEAKVDELLEILNEQGCTYGEFEDVIRSFANDESFDGRNLANAFSPGCYNHHINRSKTKKVEENGESIW